MKVSKIFNQFVDGLRFRANLLKSTQQIEYEEQIIREVEAALRSESQYLNSQEDAEERAYCAGIPDKAVF